MPLVMEGAHNCRSDEHVIDIIGTSDGYASMAPGQGLASGPEQPSSESQPSTSSRTPVYQPPPRSPGSDTRNTSAVPRGNSRGRGRSPLNSVMWISVELFLTLGQIIAAIVVLSSSKNEKPGAPLTAWILGYASGCFGILPLLYWRFKHRTGVSEQDSSQPRGDSLQSNGNNAPLNSRVGEVADLPATGTTTGGVTQATGLPNPTLKVFVEYFKMALDCFFAVWFVVGNVWIFGGHTSSSEAPNLYRLCIIFLAFSFIGYAMPFILCTAICCCLPCLTSALSFREEPSGHRGATQETINSLPTFKFKEKKHSGSSHRERNAGKVGGGTLAVGTEKERTLSGEDAVCCICLSKYANNDELRELPCSHLFHKHCVGKWLKLSASCPLCKAEVGKAPGNSATEVTANLRNDT